MNERITQALTKLFERHRIVFWNDAKQELREDYEALTIVDVDKIELVNNEFAVKHRILREKPNHKFLLYRYGEPPNDLNNWLLDVQLAHGEFRTDQVAIWLSEFELGLEFADVVKEHAELFQAAKRKEQLKKWIQPDDSPGKLRLNMLAVCAGSEPRMDSVVEHLLQEASENRDEKLKLIQRCRLDGFLWEQMKRHFGYVSNEPSVRDFFIELFKSCYAMGIGGAYRLSGDALVFLKRWKDSRQFEGSFETLSGECADVLNIEHDVSKREIRDLIELDYFRLIDQKIISDLVRAVVAQTVSSGDVTLWVRQRRQSHWYGEFRHMYEAVDVAAQFISALREVKLEMESLSDGVKRYCQTWFKLDQYYRKFTYHVRASGQASLMGELASHIENLYSNSFLLKLGNTFQMHVEEASLWESLPVRRADSFFEQWIGPYLRKENKVCVIISDAMRYEVGDELLSLIRQEDKYSAEIEPMLAMLPSYTQLGMAALLPNKNLAISDNDTGSVLVDGQSSQGLSNRSKILKSALNGRADAIMVDTFMAMSRDDARDMLKASDVVYLYHNRIDHTGDKMGSEGQAFEAAEQTLDDLLKVVKKLTANNVTNILITADHGFIYQDRALDESDFSSVDADGDTILYRDRRFVLGKGLKTSPSLHTLSSEKLSLTGDVEVQVPKSINRLRLKGSGSRFVHGGATLQEVVIPVLRINKKRLSDVTSVDVEILRGANTVITSGQLVVIFYQVSPVTDKVQPRELLAGLYTESGDLISDSHELRFDLISENARERELQVRFVLSRKADEVNGQEVILRLDERHAGTTHYKEYKSLRYMMRRSFTSDFDF